MHYIYMAKCADDSLYTGYAKNVEDRIKTHNKGKGAKYTRSRLPVELVYKEQLETKGQALSREAQIKKLKREDKLKLISSSLNLLNSTF